MQDRGPAPRSRALSAQRLAKPGESEIPGPEDLSHVKESPGPEELNEGAGSLQLVHPYYSVFFCYVSNCLTDQELVHNGLAGSPIQFVSKNGRLSPRSK